MGKDKKLEQIDILSADIEKLLIKVLTLQEITIGRGVGGRELSLVLTKLEEAKLWNQECFRKINKEVSNDTN